MPDNYDAVHTVRYAVTTAATDQFFIPGNCQAPTNSHDNPDNGTVAQRRAANLHLSPNGQGVASL
mgnify:CR=1 FL=1